MQNSKYLVANERDAYWGLTVSTVGFDTVEVGESYPTKGHADGYYFDMDKGRELNEYQMLYLLEGEGTFRSAHVEETKIKTGDVFLLFPGEWHTYGPLPHSRWKSYWIGFKGKNMDERVANGFLSVEKPIYRVGFSVEMIELYKNALKAANEEAAYSQQLLAGIVNRKVKVHVPHLVLQGVAALKLVLRSLAGAGGLLVLHEVELLRVVLAAPEDDNVLLVGMGVDLRLVG